jgi:hypothetical protein
VIFYKVSRRAPQRTLRIQVTLFRIMKSADDFGSSSYCANAVGDWCNFAYKLRGNCLRSIVYNVQ